MKETLIKTPLLARGRIFKVQDLPYHQPKALPFNYFISQKEEKLVYVCIHMFKAPSNVFSG